MAGKLVKLGAKVRNLKNHGLDEGVSTRLLIYAATLIREGIPADQACDVAVARPVTDDPDMQRSILELVKAIF
jgi:nitric oxide reductase NorQ protein